LTDIPKRRAAVPPDEAEQINALILGTHPPATIRRAYNMVRVILNGRERT
jgi:hypothetical protein